MPGRTWTLATTHPASRALQRALEHLAVDARLTPTLAVRFVELALGLSNAQIANRHGLTVNTVKTEVSQVLRALGVDSRTAISSAYTAARRRASSGATEAELLTFFRDRFE